ncbi:uncharacterized protein LOC123513124 isoform X2 [Portunus trituberculatus]|uniref:uncharacterized protein LOC123513124 isoform X2 n=1 Tax=Portunus trituberculatus TaxID=210409 RepID=UPI001E1D1939|nr:uncharacterized protein LOC123513124 isoform X2 [Portunus trituberculatus]
MKVLAVLLFATAALAAPQGVDIEDAAEIVPSKTVPGEEGGEEGFVFIVPRWNPFRNIFRNIFSGQPSVPETEGGVVFDGAPEDPSGRRGIFSFINNIFGLVPTPSENATVTFRNSSIEVINIGGVPMQVNRTIVEHTDTNGSVFRRVDQRILGPLNATDAVTTDAPNASDATLPNAQDDANELEDFGAQMQTHHLQKRWVYLLKDALKRFKNEPSPSHNHLEEEEGEEGKEEHALETNANLVPIRNEDDIAVNYINGPLPVNPDAQIFDPELVRESERRFWERRGDSAVSRPSRTQPVMSQPLRTHSVMSQPLRSHPVMSQPLRSHPVMSQPLRSHPVMSQPLRSHPVMSQPLRSHPVMSQPLRSHPVMSQPLRSQPRMSQPMRSIPVASNRTRPPRSASVRL